MKITIGERIKVRRKELDLTLRDVAKRAETSASYVSDLELNKKTPSMKNIEKLARALNVTIAWLLGEDELKNNEDVLIQNIEKDGEIYEFFLNKHIFPNGLTYEQMCDKLKTLEKIEKITKAED